MKYTVRLGRTATVPLAGFGGIQEARSLNPRVCVASVNENGVGVLLGQSLGDCEVHWITRRGAVLTDQVYVVSDVRLEPVSNLQQSAATLDTLEVNWGLPAVSKGLRGFPVRIRKGLTTDTGVTDDDWFRKLIFAPQVRSHIFIALEPETDYVVEVACLAGGTEALATTQIQCRTADDPRLAMPTLDADIEYAFEDARRVTLFAPADEGLAVGWEFRTAPVGTTNYGAPVFVLNDDFGGGEPESFDLQLPVTDAGVPVQQQVQRRWIPLVPQTYKLGAWSPAQSLAVFPTPRVAALSQVGGALQLTRGLLDGRATRWRAAYRYYTFGSRPSANPTPPTGAFPTSGASRWRAGGWQSTALTTYSIPGSRGAPSSREYQVAIQQSMGAGTQPVPASAWSDLQTLSIGQLPTPTFTAAAAANVTSVTMPTPPSAFATPRGFEVRRLDDWEDSTAWTTHTFRFANPRTGATASDLTKALPVATDSGGASILAGRGIIQARWMQADAAGGKPGALASDWAPMQWGTGGTSGGLGPKTAPTVTVGSSVPFLTTGRGLRNDVYRVSRPPWAGRTSLTGGDSPGWLAWSWAWRYINRSDGRPAGYWYTGGFDTTYRRDSLQSLADYIEESSYVINLPSLALAEVACFYRYYTTYPRTTLSDSDRRRYSRIEFRTMLHPGGTVSGDGSDRSNLANYYYGRPLPGLTMQFGEPTFIEIATVEQVTPPPAPSGITLSTGGTLSWDAVTGANQYWYEVDRFESGAWRTISSGATTATSRTISLAGWPRGVQGRARVASSSLTAGRGSWSGYTSTVTRA